MTEPETALPGSNASHRLSIRGVSLTVALALSIATALVLSYDLVLLMTPTDDVAVPTATVKECHFSFLDHPADLPEIRFVMVVGRCPSRLAIPAVDRSYSNLWGDLCVPCRKEMPSLDRLQAKFDPSQFSVLTLIDQDRRGVPAIKQFYQELGSIPRHLSRSTGALCNVASSGLPTTLFVDRDGR